MTREEAIMAVKEVTEMSLPWNDRHYESLQMAIKALEEPERKTGYWIPQDHNHTHGNVSTCIYFLPVCSECGHTGDFNMNYCPNCGARMDKDEK